MPTKRQTRLDSILNSDTEISRVYQKIRNHAAGIKISGYDVTKKCNLRCEGCFFFEGELSAKFDEIHDLEEYDVFFKSEKERGITFPHFAGAEPALVQDKLRVASRYWQQGLVYTNGTIKIDKGLPFMLHVSVWGNSQTDLSLRGRSVFNKAVENMRGDNRAIFMYTINRHNINEIPEVVAICADNNLKISFNHYSPSRQYLEKVHENADHDRSTFRLSSSDDNLSLRPSDLDKSKNIISEVMKRHPATVIYSNFYNRWIHEPDPRYDIDSANGIARDCVILNKSYHRQYHTDFSYDDSECCVANIDCTGCRHYVSGYTKIMNGFRSSLRSANDFKNWIEVYDTWCRLHFIGWDSSR